MLAEGCGECNCTFVHSFSLGFLEPSFWKGSKSGSPRSHLEKLRFTGRGGAGQGLAGPLRTALRPPHFCSHGSDLSQPDATFVSRTRFRGDTDAALVGAVLPCRPAWAQDACVSPCGAASVLTGRAAWSCCRDGRASGSRRHLHSPRSVWALEGPARGTRGDLRREPGGAVLAATGCSV